jgi:Cu/Ag efflux protein CusF
VNVRPSIAAVLVFSVMLGFGASLSTLSAQTSGPASSSPSKSSAAQANGKKAHAFRGTVEKIDVSAGILTVSGDNVPGWMGPMTMNYRIDKTGDLTLKAGDHIAATVYDGDFSTLHDVRVVAATPTAANELPPVSYVCPTPGEEGVLDDKPGNCPQSGTPLLPIRITTVYSCLKFESFIREKPGICPVDKSELVPITAALYFTCKDDSKVHELEPGGCGDGRPRIKSYERRAHGDHNPRHGGQFFMADDNWHHLEGTWVEPHTFRVYFYNDMTQPLAVTGFSARAAKSDAQGNEAGPFASLKPVQTPVPASVPAPVQNKGRNILEVPMPVVELPAKFTLRVKFKPEDKERVFDFTFPDYSREPGSAMPVTNAAAQGRATAQPGSQAPATATAGSPYTSSPPSPSTATTASPQTGDSVTFTPGTFRPEEPLPTTTQGLLQELAERGDSVKMLLDAGNLGALWYPAIRAKDVALELEQSHANEIPEGQRAEMMSAVRRLTTAAWQIDAAGDLGNKERLLPLFRDFSAAIAGVERAYGSR